MLKLSNASLSYQKQLLFKDLQLEILEGEWVAILGKSGVGKTSLLRLIAGLTTFFSEKDTFITGTLTWQERGNVDDEIAYMAQQDGLFPWLSIIENVLISKKLSGQKADGARAKALLEQVGLGRHLHKKPRLLSGGMRQRVALARTLLQDKAILLMDEPFSALDALTRLEMQELCVQLLRPCKKAMLMVTHDPWEALRLADRVLVLSGMPAQFNYAVTLPKSDQVRPITPELLATYDKLLAALGS